MLTSKQHFLKVNKRRFYEDFIIKPLHVIIVTKYISFNFVCFFFYSKTPTLFCIIHLNTYKMNFQVQKAWDNTSHVPNNGIISFPVKTALRSGGRRSCRQKKRQPQQMAKQFEVSVICLSPQGLVYLCIKDGPNPVRLSAVIFLILCNKFYSSSLGVSPF